MQRLLYSIALTVLFAGLVAQGFAGEKHSKHKWGRGHFSINTNAGAPGDACDDHFQVSSDEGEVFTDEETQSIAPAAFASGVNVRGMHNGGMLVRGWDKNEVMVKACKAVVADEAGIAKQLLSQLKLRVSGGDVTVAEPARADGERSKWAVHLLVNVPRNIKLALDTHNGPLSLRDVVGTVRAETVNGPLSIHRCSGQIEAEAQNGPVKVYRSSGDIRVRTVNGPLDVELGGSQWSGAGLEASAKNGPIQLRIPSNYDSGVEVTARGYSPFRCDAAPCTVAVKDWDDRNRTVRFGKSGQPAVVRMSTINGPVSIKSTMQ